MKKGYVIVTEKIRDADALNAYAQKAGATCQQYGGRPLVFHDGAEVLEGTWHGERTLVIEFESVDAAHAWYRSPEYQAIIGERHSAAESNLVVVPGF